MINCERRGELDFSRNKDSLVVRNEIGTRVAIFFNDESQRINVAVDMPHKSGVRCYSVDFDWLLEHLRELEPNDQLDRPEGCVSKSG